jgi:hypothetical protein
MSTTINRRRFLETAATAAVTFTILPRHVLGGKNYVAPSDIVNFAYIGTGTEGIREIFPFLSTPNVRVVAICDPQKDAIGYKDWSPNGTKNQIRMMTKNASWEPGGDNTIPGGRECGKSIVETYYANNHPEYKYKECKAYADVRQLFDKEKNIDAVKIMTPDHLHGVLCMAAMKRGKHVMVHKPLSNRLLEGKKVIEYARSSNVITHLTPWDANGSMDQVMTWINGGVIGNLKEIHNWTNRPVWPQYDTLPTDNSPIPFGFDWDLWLGPEADRPYSPNYTNMVFRGWYDFGGGSMADMGHYSLWVVFKALQLEKPTLIVPNLTHVTAFNGVVPFQIKNDFSFPTACSVRFAYPAKGSRPAVDLIWYDGGIRPAIPDELLAQNKELEPEGMMFVGDKGKILAGFHVDNPQILSGTRMETATAPPLQNEVTRYTAAIQTFINGIKSGQQYTGSFREAEDITEAINLYSVALRSRSALRYDAAARTITNNSDANKYLSREYRPGWDLETI